MARLILFAVAALSLPLAAVASPQDDRRRADREFAVPGVVTDQAQVWAYIDQRCNGDGPCVNHMRHGWATARDRYVHGGRSGRRAITGLLQLYTENGVTDWFRAGNAAIADSKAATQWLKDAAESRCNYGGYGCPVTNVRVTN